ncbi:hypothetical protein [Deinococcus sp. DB0503]|uniref:hypothetical protein n=1 Tax=Deinococcus sp. DB0503 TaxID=2479203 RepID=UPI0018DF6707|nr:hypothetical protein [Deinococcus sp. DB0503]MBI0446544.1 acetyltransferase [Deinococcus sp. DB0503]
MSVPTPPVIDLSRAGPGNFRRTRPKWFELLWIVTEALLVTNPLQLSSSLRRWALVAFGADIGRGVILRPRLRVKFPWNLSIGDHCWIGEGVWIHNQAMLTVEHDCVISQETFLTTGSHRSRTNMDLYVSPIYIEAGVWITSRCIVLQNVRIGRNALVTPGSVVIRSLDANGIYSGNPARQIGQRFGKPES